jgi:hypothetical protein
MIAIKLAPIPLMHLGIPNPMIYKGGSDITIKRYKGGPA